MILIFFSKNMISKLGWAKSAALTPLVVLTTGAIFYTFVIFEPSLKGVASYLGTTPLWIAVILGGIQNVLSKGIKYALFDPTKEMTYIPLEEDLKVKGKAAVDVVGGRMGKSGGSIIITVFSGIFGKGAGMVPYLMIILVALSSAWIYAVKGLSILYKKKLDETKSD
jgi:AAA family ATP:ADP antiporter